jgi:rod shape-determining protein MreC
MLKAPGTPVNNSETLVRFLVLVVLSIGLMYLDYPDGRYRQRANDLISIISYPLTAIAAMPATAAEWISDSLQSDDNIRKQLVTAREENLKLHARLQQFDALEAENNQLREMFAASKRVAERSMVAKLLAVNPDPTTRTIVIDKGRKEGVFQGQPVIDAHGVIGQVTEANLFDSRVTLITDSSHDIPVQVVRNGLRTILKGSSGSNDLVAPFLTRSADIRKGDKLVTSGLGGRFPPNYPVARVERVVADPNEAFLNITAQPMAELDHGRLVLLIWPGKAKPKMDETP